MYHLHGYFLLLPAGNLHSRRRSHRNRRYGELYVGQITYHHYGENGSLLAQGIQQPYEILIYSGIDISGINLHISVYPNPVQQHLKLTVTDRNTDQMTYQIYDLNGRLLAKKMLDRTETSIRMDLLAPSVYSLRVHGQEIWNQTFFKIS